MIYVLIETQASELRSVEMFNSLAAAKRAFQTACNTHGLQALDKSLLKNELTGTLAIAGGARHCAQLIERSAR